MTREGFLEVDNLTKTFDGQAAIRGVGFELARGQLLALLGPSGSGKTTTLRLLAGFESPDEGRIGIDGQDVTRLSPVQRKCGMVFQHFALFPHLDVGKNVAFGLESLRIHGSDQDRRVSEALDLVELGGFERRRIDQLSGGQQQRVALARALAPEPRILLLDEPLSNLDPSLRERTRRELRLLLRRIGITTVLVTHEQEEAFDLGDVTVLLREGEVEQVGPSEELYSRPTSPFVASFVGRGSFLDVTCVPGTAPGTVSVKAGGASGTIAVGGLGGGPARLFVRPESLSITPVDDAPVRGTVIERRFTGPVAFLQVRLSDNSVVEVAGDPEMTSIGDQVGLNPAERGLHLFPANG